jgi:enamine deaminase RidA (YjgF/YER057c/UK114 family)
MTITRIDPSTVNSAPGLIAQIVAPRDRDLVFISGQVAWDVDGLFTGVGDHGAQIAQIARNIDAILEELGVDRDAIVKETIYVAGWTPELLPVIVGGLRNGSAVPASTLIGVAALFHPEALVEVELVVAMPRT